jgi:hypothetical protein
MSDQFDLASARERLLGAHESYSHALAGLQKIANTAELDALLLLFYAGAASSSPALHRTPATISRALLQDIDADALSRRWEKWEALGQLPEMIAFRLAEDALAAADEDFSTIRETLLDQPAEDARGLVQKLRAFDVPYALVDEIEGWLSRVR